jgi:hypothetical protein
VPISFANHTTKMSSENPFMKAPASTAFAIFSPQQTSTFQAKPRHENGPQDFTIQPSKINQALSNSFGSSHGYGTNQLLSIPQDMNTPPQQDSYLQSQTISLLSDDEGDVIQPSQRPQGDSTGDTEATEELYDESSDQDESAAMNGHVNPYALLARQEVDEEDDGESFDSQLENEDRYDENGYDEDGRIPNGYADSEDEDQEAIDGDIDDDESESIGEDEGARRYEHGEDEDEDTQHAHWLQQQYDTRWVTNPQKNDALQGVGNTAEEAIELSD